MSDEVAVQFTRDELDLPCYGFGFFVQESPMPDNAPENALLSKLFALTDEQDKSKSVNGE